MLDRNLVLLHTVNDFAACFQSVQRVMGTVMQHLSDMKTALGGYSVEEACKIIRKTKQVHSNWYMETYPDVAASGLIPAEHYLRFGAAMGRDPGKGFKTKFYLDSHPDAVASKLNPLLHYALVGENKGLARKDIRTDPVKRDRKDIDAIRSKLLSLGFTDTPVEEFEAICNDPEASQTKQSMALRQLALWSMRAQTEEGYTKALLLLARAYPGAPDLAYRSKLRTCELLCHYHLSQPELGLKVYQDTVLAGEINADVMLARANFADTVDDRCHWINRVLQSYGIAPITVRSSATQSVYDELTALGALEKVSDGPKITILLAAYDAADTLGTALRSIQEQTWQNWECLVIDDCSPDGGATARVAQAFALRDPRIKLIQMPENGGAYVARNCGLDQATGEFVTIHDADDWSHPQKLEVQARFLQKNPGMMGCTTQQARAFSNLTFTRWTGQGQFIITNTSSFMYRRAPMRLHLGYWDTVRFSADNELIRRMREVFGREAVPFLESGPYSFQRDSDSSIVADDVLGVNGFMFGARREYLDAQNYHRAHAKVLKYQNSNLRRPFSAPGLMKPERKKIKEDENTFSVVTTTDFRMPGGSIQSTFEELKAAKRFGLKAGVFELNRYDVNFGSNVVRTHMLDESRQAIYENDARILCYGEEVECDLLILRYPPILHRRQRYLPKVNAKDIRVIVNQPPMSDYTEDGIVRYDIKACAENIRHYFGKDATWHPIGPLIRDTLNEHHADQLQHIDLSPQDWTNIIDVDGWARGDRKRSSADTLRIGRHSRDNFVKWPGSKEDVLAVYPACDDVEVHILGGAKTPAELIGGVPENWTVHEFGALHPREFLADIDVFVYFSHPDWVESFGRTIIEAMAVGVPVILPEVYKPLFQKAALYATPETAVNLARRLHADDEAYDKQVKIALEYTKIHFGYGAHGKRVSDITGKQIQSVDIASTANSTLPNIRHIVDPRRQASDKSFPMWAGKISKEQLSDLSSEPWEPGAPLSKNMAGFYDFRDQGFQFDCLWHPNPDKKRLFVLFAGDALRSKFNPPVFHRWSWARFFPGHCLYVSDPSLYLYERMGLAWYAGTKDYDPLVTLASRIKQVCKDLGIALSDVYSYGSSGGGFAALRLLTHLPDAAAISINPQTTITNFEMSSVETYLSTCYGIKDRKEALVSYPTRLSIVLQAESLKARRILHIQNVDDTHHFKEHYVPLCDAFGVNYDESLGNSNLKRILFKDPRGHRAPEPPGVFDEVMALIESGRF